MIYWGVLTVLAASLILYLILGGADFGAGILEGLGGKKLAAEQEKLITKAMGPVWEANHMWLILAVVIMFNGFPFIYSFVSTVLHLPVLVMLAGIILRGCSFTYRHYDPFHHEGNPVYARIFAWSSLLTPFTMGVMAGAMTEGVFYDPFSKSSPGTFADVYLGAWLSVFSVACGFFTLTLCTLTAACFLFCEAGSGCLKKFYGRIAGILLAVVAATGGLVWGISFAEQGSLARQVSGHPLPATIAVMSTLFLGVMTFFAIRKNRIFFVRAGVSGLVAVVTVGWIWSRYPVILFYTSDSALLALTFQEHQASGAALRHLWYALVLGVVLVVPALIFLLRTFKKS